MEFDRSLENILGGIIGVLLLAVFCLVLGCNEDVTFTNEPPTIASEDTVYIPCPPGQWDSENNTCRKVN